MAHGLANKHHQTARAKAKAAKHFKTLYGNAKWVTAKVIGKKAATSSVCGTSGCAACSAKFYYSYTNKHHAAKVAVIFE